MLGSQHVFLSWVCHAFWESEHGIADVPTYRIHQVHQSSYDILARLRPFAIQVNCVSRTTGELSTYSRCRRCLRLEQSKLSEDGEHIVILRDEDRPLALLYFHIEDQVYRSKTSHRNLPSQALLHFGDDRRCLSKELCATHVHTRAVGADTEVGKQDVNPMYFSALAKIVPSCTGSDADHKETCTFLSPPFTL